MRYQGELSIVGACGGYSKTPAKHAPAVGNSVLNSPINNLGSGSSLLRLFAKNMNHQDTFTRPSEVESAVNPISSLNA